MALDGTCRRHVKERGVHIMAVRSRRLSVLLNHVAVLRRRRHVPVSLLCGGLCDPAICEAMLQFPQRQLIWSIHPTVATQRGFWEQNVIGKWRATA